MEGIAEIICVSQSFPNGLMSVVLTRQRPLGQHGEVRRAKLRGAGRSSYPIRLVMDQAAGKRCAGTLSRHELNGHGKPGSIHASAPASEC